MDSQFLSFLRDKTPPHGYRLVPISAENIAEALEHSKVHFPGNPLSKHYLDSIMIKGHGVGVFIKPEDASDIAASICCELNSQNKRIYISEIIVSENHRGRGLGLFLNDLMYEYGLTHGYQSLCSNVAVDNEMSINMHKKAGFEIVRTDLQYFDDGADAHYFRKKITNA